MFALCPRHSSAVAPALSQLNAVWNPALASELLLWFVTGASASCGKSQESVAYVHHFLC